MSFLCTTAEAWITGFNPCSLTVLEAVLGGLFLMLSVADIVSTLTTRDKIFVRLQLWDWSWGLN